MPRKRDPNKPIMTREQVRELARERSKEVVRARMVERYERMESDIRNGMQVKVIADKYNVSTRMVERARKYFGLAKPNNVIPQENYDKALMLLQDGASYKDASETFGMSAEALRHKYPGYGWGNDRTLTGQHGAIMKKLHRIDNKHSWEKFGTLRRT